MNCNFLPTTAAGRTPNHCKLASAGSEYAGQARILGRSPGTISRELMRNSSPVGYASAPAAAFCRARGKYWRLSSAEAGRQP
ncbi:helix-turn-helix domain-containing protein [Caballeronia sp. SBC1]|uniref:helix-turn-helix domain-containing protein n=1 Tax=Caballeronia sp. SBC1 TaxID=2705548 RepID=UPI00140E122A